MVWEEIGGGRGVGVEILRTEQRCCICPDIAVPLRTLAGNNFARAYGTVSSVDIVCTEVCDFRPRQDSGSVLRCFRTESKGCKS